MIWWRYIQHLLLNLFQICSIHVLGNHEILPWLLVSKIEARYTLFLTEAHNVLKNKNDNNRQTFIGFLMFSRGLEWDEQHSQCFNSDDGCFYYFMDVWKLMEAHPKSCISKVLYAWFTICYTLTYGCYFSVCSPKWRN